MQSVLTSLPACRLTHSRVVGSLNINFSVEFFFFYYYIFSAIIKRQLFRWTAIIKIHFCINFVSCISIDIFSFFLLCYFDDVKLYVTRSRIARDCTCTVVSKPKELIFLTLQVLKTTKIIKNYQWTFFNDAPKRLL